MRTNTWITRVCTSLVFIMTILETLPFHSDLHQRDQILKELSSIPRYEIQLSAEEYCRLNLKENFSQIPCNTIDPKYFSPKNEVLDSKASEELLIAIKSYQSLLSILNGFPSNSGQLLELQGIVERKMTQLNKILEAQKRPAYPDLFKGLLIAQGSSYNAMSNRFKLLPQNIAQVIINQNGLQEQIFILEFASQYLYLFYIIIFFSSLFLIYKKVSSIGFFIFSLYLGAVFFGLSLIRDASLHYGFESSAFDLSPFRQLYQRQIVVALIAISIVILFIRYSSPIAKLFTWALNRASITLVTLICTTGIIGSYFLLGPAIGSEFFKVSSCFIAAFLLFRHGRTLELAQEQFGLKSLLGKSLSYLGLFASFSKNNLKEVHLNKYYIYFLFWKIFIQLVFIACLLFLVSAFYHDLGGSLIAGLVFFFCLFVLLGKKFATLLIGLFTLTGILIFAISEKVQNRIELMLEPMRANISDFGRLIQFENAGQPLGYGIGSIKWCSADGVCIPLQTLSDYMPTLINGALGKTLGLLFLAGMAYLWIVLAYRGFMASWLYQEEYKFAKLLGSLLCLAALFQLVVTTLGNLRVIPLTGLGTPLISIGISSSISASIGIGLIIGLCYARE